jgi:hypothetical protein
VKNVLKKFKKMGNALKKIAEIESKKGQRYTKKLSK